MEPKLTRAAQIVKWFVERLSGRLGRTQLIKLVYLSDCLARGYLGRPISDLQYVWWHYGPYDCERFPAALSALVSAELVVERPYVHAFGEGFVYADAGEPIPTDFTPAELEILGYVLRKFGRLKRAALVEDVVYQTPPMRECQAAGETARGVPLNMDVLDNALTKKLHGVSLERVLAGERDVKEGRHVSLDEAFARVLPP